METRYLLPAAVAASLHLIALFGFNSPVPSPTAPPVVPVKPLPSLPVDIADPVEPIEDPVLSEEKPPKGTEVLRPGSDEPEAKTVITEITMPRPPPSPRPVEITTTIVPGAVGVPDGTDGPWSERAVISFRGLDNAPRTRSQIAPSYPTELRSAAVTGEVVVAFIVNEDGRVSHAAIVRSTDPRFEAATLKAIERWRFEPGKRNGRPVRFRMEVPVVFSLNE